MKNYQKWEIEGKTIRLNNNTYLVGQEVEDIYKGSLFRLTNVKDVRDVTLLPYEKILECKEDTYFDIYPRSQKFQEQLEQDLKTKDYTHVKQLILNKKARA